MQHVDNLRQLLHQAHIVLDDDDGAAEPRRRPAHDLHHCRGFLGRQAGARLVEQQHARLGQKRHRQFEDLLLAVRQFRRLARARGQEGIACLQFLEHRAGPAAKPRIEQGELAGAAAPQRDRQVVSDREIGKHAWNLQLAGDAETADAMGRKSGDGRAAETDRAGCRGEFAADDIEHRGLAGAVRADDAEYSGLIEVDARACRGS